MAENLLALSFARLFQMHRLLLPNTAQQLATHLEFFNNEMGVSKGKRFSQGPGYDLNQTSWHQLLKWYGPEPGGSMAFEKMILRTRAPQTIFYS